MDKLVVSVAQLCVRNDDIDANLKGIERAIDIAAEQGADILLTPEGSLSGYTFTFDREKVEAALAQVTKKAKEKHVGLALGTGYYETETECYNQVRIYDKDGNFLGAHNKILRCGTLKEPYEGEIAHFKTTPLRTFDFHGITIGALVCNDMWGNPGCTPMDDPHLAQKLADMGAKVILHAVNGGRDESEFSQVVCRNYHESNLRLRAFAGNVWIAVTDNAYPPEKPNSCTGGVIGPDGKWRITMDIVGEQQCCYTIEL